MLSFLHFDRWIVPAGSETVLRIRFSSEELGQFDQTLNFELVGTRRRYQLFCRGVCSFPTVSNPKCIAWYEGLDVVIFDITLFYFYTN